MWVREGFKGFIVRFFNQGTFGAINDVQWSLLGWLSIAKVGGAIFESRWSLGCGENMKESSYVHAFSVRIRRSRHYQCYGGWSKVTPGTIEVDGD